MSFCISGSIEYYETESRSQTWPLIQEDRFNNFYNHFIHICINQLTKIRISVFHYRLLILKKFHKIFTHVQFIIHTDFNILYAPVYFI